MPKSFIAETMREALLMVQAELGPDAIVLSAREAPLGSPWNVWKRPGVEVVAMAPGELPVKEASPAAGEAATDASPSQEKISGWQPRRITREEARLANQASRVPRTEASTVKLSETPGKVDLPPAPSAPVDKEEEPVELPPALAALRRQLLAQEVDEAFVERTLQVALQGQSKSLVSTPETAQKNLARLLEAEVTHVVPSYLQNERRVVCVVGVSGGGKTSAVARMAMDYRQRLGKKVAWVCADTLRTGAIGEARAYTDALDLPLRLVYTPQDLSAALAGLDDVDLVVIDTPGYNPYREQEIVELGGLLSELPERALYLVVPANIKEGDLFCMSGALSVFGLDGVIVTKLDETSTYGGVYNFVRKSRLPLAYFTFGKAASAGLEAATSQRLVAALFGKGWNQ